MAENANITREEFDRLMSLLEGQAALSKEVEQIKSAVERVLTQNETLLHIATHDNLTNLQNRDGMESYIADTAAKFLKNGEEVSVIVFDIDHFKKFNDTYGHDVGDKCLKQVAKVLQANIRSSEDSEVFRWGGEEFVVITPNDAEKTKEIADRLRTAIENTPLEIGDDYMEKITVSGGVAQIDSSVAVTNIRDAFTATFEDADRALYYAKENGRNQIQRIDALEITMKAEKEVQIVAKEEFGLHEDVVQNTVDKCTSLLEMLSQSENLEQDYRNHVDAQLQQNGDWHNISQSLQKANVEALKEMFEHFPNLSIEAEATIEGATVYVQNNLGETTVEFTGQTKDELIHQLSGGDVLILGSSGNNSFSTHTLAVTNDFLVTLASEMSKNGYEAEYISDMIGRNGQVIYLESSNRDGITLVLENDKYEGEMALSEEVLPDHIIDVLREAQEIGAKTLDTKTLEEAEAEVERDGTGASVQEVKDITEVLNMAVSSQDGFAQYMGLKATVDKTADEGLYIALSDGNQLLATAITSGLEDTGTILLTLDDKFVTTLARASEIEQAFVNSKVADMGAEFMVEYPEGIEALDFLVESPADMRRLDIRLDMSHQESMTMYKLDFEEGTLAELLSRANIDSHENAELLISPQGEVVAHLESGDYVDVPLLPSEKDALASLASEYEGYRKVIENRVPTDPQLKQEAMAFIEELNHATQYGGLRPIANFLSEQGIDLIIKTPENYKSVEDSAVSKGLLTEALQEFADSPTFDDEQAREASRLLNKLATLNKHALDRQENRLTTPADQLRAVIATTSGYATTVIGDYKGEGVKETVHDTYTKTHDTYTMNVSQRSDHNLLATMRLDYSNNTAVVKLSSAVSLGEDKAAVVNSFRKAAEDRVGKVTIKEKKLEKESPSNTIEK